MIYLLLIIIIFAVFILLAPRADLSDDVSQPVVNEELRNLDDYLAKAESQYDLYSHANKQIIWFDGYKQTELAVLYLHGYSATRSEIDPVPQMVAKALGANLFYARYTGHGLKGDGDAYKGVTVRHWYSDSLEALAIGKLLGKKVVVMGHSTGCTFGTWLANRFPTDIAAQLYLSPNYYPQDKGVMAIVGPWGKQLLKLTKGNYNTFNDEEMLPAEGGEPIWSMSQHTDAIIAMVSAVKKVQMLKFDQMTTPLFIVCSPNDKVVRTRYTQKVFNRYGAKQKELLLLDSSKSTFQHTITGDVRDASTNDMVANAMTTFVKKLN